MIQIPSAACKDCEVFRQGIEYYWQKIAVWREGVGGGGGDGEEEKKKASGFSRVLQVRLLWNCIRTLGEVRFSFDSFFRSHGYVPSRASELEFDARFKECERTSGVTIAGNFGCSK